MNKQPKRTVKLVEAFPGDTSVAVYRPRNKEPHFIIIGTSAENLNKDKIADYMYGCDWADKDSKGWITPHLRCDEFMNK